MTLRTRMIITNIFIILLPLLVLGILLRTSMSRRLSEQYDSRIEVLLTSIDGRMQDEESDLAARLGALRDAADLDQPLLLAVAGLSEHQPYLRTFVEQGRALSGLDLFLLAEGSGEVHAASPDDYRSGRPVRLMLNALRERAGAPGLIHAGLGDTTGLVLVALDSVTISGRTLYLAGGRRVDQPFIADLAGGGAVDVSLVYDGGAISAAADTDLQRWLRSAGEGRLLDPHNVVPRADYLVRGADFPAALADGPKINRLPLVDATLVLTHSRAAWFAMLRDLDSWLLLVIVMICAATLIASAFLAARITRPLTELANNTAAVELDHLSSRFPTSRKDEVGILSRYMDDMQTRLRLGLERLRESERRVALGDLARQVNHDLRNGFLPMRNVIWHLSKVAKDDPAKLSQVYLDRQATLDSALKYLEDLAGGYKRIAGGQDSEPVDLNSAVMAAISGFPPTVSFQASEHLVVINLDPTSLRRIVQNLVRNSLQSLYADSGRVGVSVRMNLEEQTVALVVKDNGHGMDPEQVRQATEQFYTTREEGTGLGLNIVQRLVADAGGSLDIVSQQGLGTTVTIEFPVSSG
jgi:signal transduction histidine kinase